MTGYCVTSASATPMWIGRPRSPSGGADPSGHLRHDGSDHDQPRGRPMHNACFRRLAQYNAWANRRIYEACAQLSDAERKAARACFFGSIHRTLNHILVGDRLWLSRLTGSDSGFISLGYELYSDFGELRAARVTED